MKKKEIVTLALTTALLMTAHAVPASAASNAPESMSQTGSIQTITPRWESTNVVVPSISISGKQISVSVYISPKKSTTSSVGTLYLEKKVGNGWTPVTSWSIDGTGSVSITKTYTGTMGITYRTRVVVTTGVDKVGADSNKQEVTVSDLTSVTVLFGEDTTNVVNLTNGKLAKFGATINLNTKAKDYESVKTQVESAMSMIDSTLMGVIRGFDSTTPQADMEKAATNAVRELFASDTVYSVSFTQYVVQ